MASSTLGGGDAGGIAMGSASLMMGDGRGVMISARGAGCSVMEMTGRSTLVLTGALLLGLGRLGLLALLAGVAAGGF